MLTDLRNIFLGVIAVLFVIFLLTLIRTPAEKALESTNPELYELVEGGSILREIASNLVSGGPPPDGIPPIENPIYISMENADDFLNDDDIVFVTNFGGQVKLFPQRILVWHEVVNDTFGSEQGTLTYCPLTGTVIGYKNTLLDKTVTDFGTSGSLVNSNLVMYDRDSGSFWPQILRQAVTGDRAGQIAEMFPAIWTTWEMAEEYYADALVLSNATRSNRNYSYDPYGGYDDEGGYYFEGGPLFPAMNTDDRLPAKEVVLGVYDEEKIAFRKSSVMLQKEMTQQGYTARYIEELDAVEVIATETGQPADYVEGFWFAWVAYFPETALFE